MMQQMETITQNQGDMMGMAIYSTKPMIGARTFEVKETAVVGPSPTGQMRVRRNINSLTDPQFDILVRDFKRLNNANSAFISISSPRTTACGRRCMASCSSCPGTRSQI